MVQKRSENFNYLKSDSFREKTFRPYVSAIGQVVLAWNDLHEFLGYLFATVMGDEAFDRAQSVWYSAPSDRIAREMLKAAIEKNEPDFIETFPNAVSDIVWLINQSTALEDTRNSIVHTPLWRVGLARSEGPWIKPVHIHGHKRALKMSLKPDLLSEFNWCRDTALVLRDYAIKLEAALHPHQVRRAPWPNRPSLPNRGQKKRTAVRRR